MNFLIISFIILLFDIIFYLKSNKNIEISPNNKILFIKLKKQYLNNVSDDDILQLIFFLKKYLKERKKKNENKK